MIPEFAPFDVIRLVYLGPLLLCSYVFVGSVTSSCTVPIDGCLFTMALLRIWGIIVMDFKTFKYISISALKLQAIGARSTLWTSQGSRKTEYGKLYYNNGG